MRPDQLAHKVNVVHREAEEPEVKLEAQGQVGAREPLAQQDPLDQQDHGDSVVKVVLKANKVCVSINSFPSIIPRKKMYAMACATLFQYQV